jgi:hypothetical protein
MSKRLIILIIVGILFCTACFYIWNFFTGPVYSLYKSRKAIEQHDFQKFQEYINLDSIIDNFAFNMKVPNPEPEDTLEKLEMELGIGILYGLKPQMTKIIRRWTS